jgi:Domain of unknown function (DUF4407)/Helix-turn-helix domain
MKMVPMSSDDEPSFLLPGHSSGGNPPARPSAPGLALLRQGPEVVVTLTVIISLVLWFLGRGPGAPEAAAAAVGITAFVKPCVRFSRTWLTGLPRGVRSMLPRQAQKSLAGRTVRSRLIRPRRIPPGRRRRRGPYRPSNLGRAAERVTMMTTRTGRPENPLSSDGGPVAELASELRLMRRRADLTYRELAAKTGRTPSTLSVAADGQRLPSWPVTRAWVEACGGNGSTVRDLYERACTVAGRPVPFDNRPEDPPAPEAISNGAQFVEGMKLLRAWAGNPSLAQLNRRSGGFGLPPSTVSEMLRKGKLPRLDLVQAYVRACGLSDNQATAWEHAHAKIVARESYDPFKAGNHERLPQAVRERQHRGASRALRDFLEWLSGTPVGVLPRMPADHAGYSGLGATILLTSTASALFTAWAVHVVLTPKWPAAAMAGLVWGVAVASLDRMVVASIHGGRGTRRFFAVIPRLVLSLLLAPVIATPIALRIFAPEIDVQAAATQYAVQVAALNRISAEYNPQIQQLQKELVASQMQATAAQSQASCEVVGGSGCHHGQGPAYAAALTAYQSAEADVVSLQGQVSNLRNQQTAAQKNATEDQNQQGLLSNLAALNQITDQNKTIVVIRWLLFGAFALLGCVPVIVKTFKVPRSQDAYEKETLAQQAVRVPASLQRQPPGSPSAYPVGANNPAQAS